MQEFTGPQETSLKMNAVVLQSGFVDQFKKLNRTQLKLSINSFLTQERSIPLIVRIWLSVLKMPFVPLKFSKMILLNLLQNRASRLLKSVKRPQRRWFMNKARKLINRKKIG